MVLDRTCQARKPSFHSLSFLGHVPGGNWWSLRFSWRLRKQVWRSCHVKNSTGHPKIRIPNIPNWSNIEISSGGFEGEKDTPPCCGIKSHRRWAPTSDKWDYNPCKWPYKWVRGVITLLIGSSKSWTMLPSWFSDPWSQHFLSKSKAPNRGNPSFHTEIHDHQRPGWSKVIQLVGPSKVDLFGHSVEHLLKKCTLKNENSPIFLKEIGGKSKILEMIVALETPSFATKSWRSDHSQKPYTHLEKKAHEVLLGSILIHIGYHTFCWDSPHSTSLWGSFWPANLKVLRELRQVKGYQQPWMTEDKIERMNQTGVYRTWRENLKICWYAPCKYVA